MKNDLVTIEVEGQHLDWSNELSNLNDQLLNYEKILMEIKSPTNKKEVEHFQNQFLIQKNIIAKLKNDIKRHDLAIKREKSEAFDEVPREDLNYQGNRPNKHAIGKLIRHKLETHIRNNENIQRRYARSRRHVASRTLLRRYSNGQRKLRGAHRGFEEQTTQRINRQFTTEVIGVRIESKKEPLE